MTNILMVGVGGQGLVMTSGIIAEVLMQAGYDVKTNDVIGLSQRGGRVWASIRFGDKVYSPNIPEGEVDFLLALEPLEGLRYSTLLKEEGTILLNDKKMYPSDVVFEKAEYPEEAITNMLSTYKSKHLDAFETARGLGNKMAANTILLGMLAADLDVDIEIWERVISERVPAKAKAINLEAFKVGLNQ